MPRRLRTGGGRRAGIFVTVLMTSVLVVVVGLGGLLAARAQWETALALHQSIAARWCAESAIELGEIFMRDHPDWRTNPGAGDWMVKLPVAGGECELSASLVADGDADPSNDDWVLVGTGIVGGSTHTIEVVLKGGTTVGSTRRVTK